MSTTTNNMNLTLPTPTITEGPDWAEEYNTALETVDAHDHTTGKGKKITPAGININNDLDMNDNSVTSLETVQLEDVTAEPTTTQTIYSDSGELKYKDGSGNVVRVTVDGAIDISSAGGIGGAYASTAAELTYSDSTKKYTFKDSSTANATVIVKGVDVDDGTGAGTISGDITFSGDVTAVGQVDAQGDLSTNNLVIGSDSTPANNVMLKRSGTALLQAVPANDTSNDGSLGPTTGKFLAQQYNITSTARPTASDYTGVMCYETDTKLMVFSDGTNWLYPNEYSPDEMYAGENITAGKPVRPSASIAHTNQMKHVSGVNAITTLNGVAASGSLVGYDSFKKKAYYTYRAGAGAGTPYLRYHTVEEEGTNSLSDTIDLSSVFPTESSTTSSFRLTYLESINGYILITKDNSSTAWYARVIQVASDNSLTAGDKITLTYTGTYLFPLQIVQNNKVIYANQYAGATTFLALSVSGTTVTNHGTTQSITLATHTYEFPYPVFGGGLYSTELDGKALLFYVDNTSKLYTVMPVSVDASNNLSLGTAATITTPTWDPPTYDGAHSRSMAQTIGITRGATASSFVCCYYSTFGIDSDSSETIKFSFIAGTLSGTTATVGTATAESEALTSYLLSAGRFYYIPATTLLFNNYLGSVALLYTNRLNTTLNCKVLTQVGSIISAITATSSTGTGTQEYTYPTYESIVYGLSNRLNVLSCEKGIICTTRNFHQLKGPLSAVGVAQESVSSGANLNIASLGQVYTGGSGTPGAVQYIQSDGTIGATPTSAKIGRYITSSKMLVSKNP